MFRSPSSLLWSRVMKPMATSLRNPIDHFPWKYFEHRSCRTSSPNWLGWSNTDFWLGKKIQTETLPELRVTFAPSRPLSARSPDQVRQAGGWHPSGIGSCPGAGASHQPVEPMRLARRSERAWCRCRVRVSGASRLLSRLFLSGSTNTALCSLRWLLCNTHMIIECWLLSELGQPRKWTRTVTVSRASPISGD